MSEDEKRLNRLIAANITEQLRAKNRTQLELAEYLGVTQATVSNWCTGNKMPRMDKIDKICEFFGVKRSQIMCDDEPAPSSLFHLSSDEEHLVATYRDLSDIGQNKLLDYADDLHDNPRYKKLPSFSKVERSEIERAG